MIIDEYKRETKYVDVIVAILIVFINIAMS